MLLAFLYQQVRGFCVDKSNPDVFDNVNVYGNMYDSDIHHLRFGLYTYGEHRSIACMMPTRDGGESPTTYSELHIVITAGPSF